MSIASKIVDFVKDEPLLVSLGLVTPAAVKITGTPAVGQILTASPSSAFTASTYQWTRNGTNISGATAQTYTVQAADKGALLGCLVTGSVVSAGGARVPADVVTPPVLGYGVLLESFETVTGWTNQGAVGTLSSDAVNKVQGAASMRLANKGVNGTSFATKAAAFNADPSTFDLVAYYVAVDNRRPVQKISPTFGRGGTYSLSSTGVDIGTYDPESAYWASFNVSEDATMPTGVAATDLRIRPTLSAPYAGGFSIDSIVRNAPRKATICLTFDDVENTIYTFAYPRMKALGLVGTIYVCPSNVGISDSLTWAQIDELAANGWHIGNDGTMDDSNMSLKATLADAVNGAIQVRDTLVARGYPLEGAQHICYPFGEYKINKTPIQVATLTCNGTNIVTMASTAGIGVGWTCYGFGIPDGRTVVSVDSATQITLSGTVPSQALPAAFLDETHWSNNRALPDALAAQGFRTGRITNGDNYTRFGFGRNAMMLGGKGWSGQTQAGAQTLFDRAKLRGLTVLEYFHRITPAGGGIDISESLFDWYINLLATERNAGNIDVLTVSQLYARDVNGASNIPS